MKKIQASSVLLAVAISVMLAACGNDTPEPGQPKPVLALSVAELEKSGKLPVLDRGNSLAGPDVDRNGIRDDVDLYIAGVAKKNGYNPSQVKALQQAARASQSIVTLNFKDKTLVAGVAKQMMAAIDCAGDKGVRYANIANVTYNTRNRKHANQNFGRSLNGSVLALPTGDACDK